MNVQSVRLFNMGGLNFTAKRANDENGSIKNKFYNRDTLLPKADPGIIICNL